MLRCWRRILLKSDAFWRSYENMFRGLLFSRTKCRNSVAEFIRFTLIFVPRTTNSLFEPPFRGLKGNVCTLTITHFKGRDRLPIRGNCSFSLALTVETLKAEICWNRCFSNGGGSIWPQLFLIPTTVGIRKLVRSPFQLVSKYRQYIPFCHKARMWVTDGRTGEQTELRLPIPR